MTLWLLQLEITVLGFNIGFKAIAPLGRLFGEDVVFLCSNIFSKNFLLAFIPELVWLELDQNERFWHCFSWENADVSKLKQFVEMYQFPLSFHQETFFFPPSSQWNFWDRMTDKEKLSIMRVITGSRMEERWGKMGPGLTHRMHIWFWSSPYPLTPGYCHALVVHACTNPSTATTSNDFGFTLVVNMKMY